MKKVVFDANGYQFTQKAYAGLVEGTTTAGGHTVPSPLANYVIDEIAKNQWARQLFETIPINGKTLTIPTITAGDSVYFVGEGADLTTEGGADGASTSYSRPTFGTMTLTPKKFAGLTGYTTELQEDSAISVAELTLRKIARAFAEHEEKAFIQGEAAGSNFSWTAGDVRRAFDGIIETIHSSTGVTATGSNWTPTNTTYDNWIDAGSAKLTAAMLDQLLAQVEDNRGVCNVILATPKVVARLRNKTEFEMLQRADAVGVSNAALIKGWVGKYYTADVFVSHWVPEGVAVFNTATTAPKDSIVIGLDKMSPMIGDRRKIEIMQRHRFYQDINEIRVLERITMGFRYEQLLAGLADVQSAV